MDIQWLRTFVVAAKHENFRETGGELFISQPTVSVQMKQLEDALGVELFERRGRNVVLTRTGRQFLREAHHIIRAHDESLGRFQSWRQGYTHMLRIGVSPLVAASVLPEWVAQFSRLHGDVEMGIRIMDSPEIEGAVADADIDVGLSRVPSRMRSITCTSLYADPVMCVVAGEPAARSGESPPLVELLREWRVLTHNHPLYWDDLLRNLRQINPDVRTMVISQVNSTKRFVEEGFGFSFLPHSAILREVAEGRLVCIPAPELILPEAHTYLLTEWQLAPAVARFVTFLERWKRDVQESKIKNRSPNENSTNRLKG